MHNKINTKITKYFSKDSSCISNKNTNILLVTKIGDFYSGSVRLVDQNHNTELRNDGWGEFTIYYRNRNIRI